MPLRSAFKSGVRTLYGTDRALNLAAAPLHLHCHSVPPSSRAFDPGMGVIGRTTLAASPLHLLQPVIERLQSRIRELEEQLAERRALERGDEPSEQSANDPR